jgi:DNA-binding response OmpR family regulator
MSTSGICARAAHITVLFVDDDADTRFAYQSLATAEGFSVELAADGNEVARRLRASSRTRGIPIVFVSGVVSEKMQVAVRTSGCDGHLAKPCSADELLGLLNELGMRSRDPAPTIQSVAR